MDNTSQSFRKQRLTTKGRGSCSLPKMMEEESTVGSRQNWKYEPCRWSFMKVWGFTGRLGLIFPGRSVPTPLGYLNAPTSLAVFFQKESQQLEAEQQKLLANGVKEVPDCPNQGPCATWSSPPSLDRLASCRVSSSSGTPQSIWNQ